MKNIEKYQNLIAKGEVDALLLTSKHNRQYAAEYCIAEGVAVICKTQSYYFTDFRYIESAQIDLPERGVRLVSVRMHEWACDEVECYSAYSAVARLQRNRLTRATVDEPVVLRRPGRIEVHGLEPPSQTQASANADSGSAMPPSTAVPKIDSLEMVVRPPKGTYILDSTLLRQSQLLIH